MNVPEIDTALLDAQQKTINKTPQNLRWLVEMLQEPLSVRQLHRRTKAQKKRLRAALLQLKLLGLVEEFRLPGGGSVWKIREEGRSSE